MTAREPFDFKEEAGKIAIAGWHEGLRSLERNIEAFARRAQDEAYERAIEALGGCWQPQGPQPDECPACIVKRRIIDLKSSAGTGK